jgi:hypothetical protein
VGMGFSGFATSIPPFAAIHRFPQSS